MNRPHDQGREWELIQAIRRLRACGTSGVELMSKETKLLAAFDADIAETADNVRGKYRDYRLYQQDPPEHGDLENRLKLWLLHNAVAEYDPLKNDSFAMFVFNGWWMEKGGCIQQYLKQFKSPKGVVLDRDGKPKKGANGKLIKLPVRMGSLDSVVRSGDGKARPLGHIVSQGRQFVGGGLAEEFSLDGFEMRHDLRVMVDGACLTREEVLALLGPLLQPQCTVEELKRRLGQEQCTCPGCTSDEHRRREAMLVLLRSDLSCPDCSDEFQRRNWWNSLVAGPEQPAPPTPKPRTKR